MIANVEWNIHNLTTLYYKSIPNNIIVRANNTLYHEVYDNEIREYIKTYRESGGDSSYSPYYLQFGNVKAFIDDNNAEYTHTLQIHSKLKTCIICLVETQIIIERLISKMSDGALRRFIINPLRPICNRNVPHIADFTISLGNAIYNVDHPFPRDIKFVGSDGITRDAHSFVIASISPMVCSAIINTSMEHVRTFNLGCSIEVIDWFLQGAYKSCFVFDEKIDHEDGLNLLSYMLIINKVTVISELRTKLGIELTIE